MKPVAILLALASTACTVSAGLPRFAKCTANSQCNSNLCAAMRYANCDQVPNCHHTVCYGASVGQPCSNDWECNSNHCRGGTCFDCRGRSGYFSVGASCSGFGDQCCESQCRANAQGNMQCIDNTVIMDRGGQGPFRA